VRKYRREQSDSKSKNLTFPSKDTHREYLQLIQNILKVLTATLMVGSSFSCYSVILKSVIIQRQVHNADSHGQIVTK